MLALVTPLARQTDGDGRNVHAGRCDVPLHVGGEVVGDLQRERDIGSWTKVGNGRRQGDRRGRDETAGFLTQSWPSLIFAEVKPAVSWNMTPAVNQVGRRMVPIMWMRRAPRLRRVRCAFVRCDATEVPRPNENDPGDDEPWCEVRDAVLHVYVVHTGQIPLGELPDQLRSGGRRGPPRRPQTRWPVGTVKSRAHYALRALRAKAAMTGLGL